MNRKKLKAVVKNGSASGQGLIEYALILSLVGIVTISALTSVGAEVTTVFENVLCNLESGEDCNCETNEMVIRGPSYTCVGSMFAFQTLTTCRDATNLSLMVSGYPELGLTYNAGADLFETAVSNETLCTDIEGSTPPSAYIISRHTEDGGVNTFPVSFASGGSSGGTGGTGGTGGGEETPEPTSNTDPVLNPIGNKSVNEGVTLTVSISSSDADAGDTLSLSATGLTAFMTFVGNGDGTGTLKIDPTFDDSGTYTVTITVSDGNGGSDSETFNVEVVNVFVNHAPTLATIGGQTLNEGASQNVTITATDPDGDPLTFSATGLAGFMTLTDNGDGTATLTLAPTSSDSGTTSVTVTVSDGQGGTANETFSVVVNDVNQNPALTAIGNQTVNESATLTVNVVTSDGDGDPITLTATGLTAFMSFTDNGNGTGVLTITPGYTDAGNYPLTINVADDAGGSTYESFSVSVVNVNRPPVLNTIGNQAVNEGETLTINASATDPDGDTITFSATGLTSFMTPADEGPGQASLTVSPTQTDAGEYTITVTISDGMGGTDTETFKITVIDVAVSEAVLFVTGSTSLNSAESSIKTGLEGDGYTVTVQDDDSCQTVHADGKVLVIISDSVDSGKVGVKYRDIPIPVVTMETALYDEMRLSNSTGTYSSSRYINVVTPSIAAGYSGWTRASNSNISWTWGIPAGGATIGAYRSGSNSEATYFVYETGASMTSGTAPARRVAIWTSSVAASVNSRGWAIWDAAIAWALG